MNNGHGPVKLLIRINALIEIAHRPNTINSTFCDSTTPTADSSTTSATDVDNNSSSFLVKKCSWVGEGTTVVGLHVLLLGPATRLLQPVNDDWAKRVAVGEDGAKALTFLETKAVVATARAALLMNNMVYNIVCSSQFPLCVCNWSLLWLDGANYLTAN